jgi:two-component system, NarL family, response regulator LiaR
MDNPTETIRVLIVDDHQVVRQGLRTFLELHEDILVVGEAGNGDDAVALAARLTPDVILMDLVMPVMDGITATSRIKSNRPDTRVIALTSFTEDDKIFPAIQAGASSYLLKDVTPDELVGAIRAVHHGETRLHPEVMRRLVEQVAQAHQPPVKHAKFVPVLTEREHEVLQLVAEGKSNRRIAEALTISEKTVKAHISNILGKLGLNDRTQMAIYAIKNGLVDQDGS